VYEIVNVSTVPPLHCLRFEPTCKPNVNLLAGEPPSYYYKPVDEHYDDFFYSAQKTSDKEQFLKLPRYQKNLKQTSRGLIATATK
jgi:hypothetical protein